MIPLTYATPPRRWRLKRIHRLLIILCLVVAAGGAAAWRWGPPMWDHARQAYWQRQCMAYTAPPDQVVYEDDPAIAATLLKKSGYMNATGSRGAAYQPKCSTEYSDLFSWRRAVLFLHERSSGIGERRLVSVVFDGDCYPTVSVSNWCDTTVHKPLPWLGWPPGEISPIKSFRDGLTYLLRKNGLRSWDGTTRCIRFFAGQPDPADNAHFTINYERWSGPADSSKSPITRGVLDGRLSDDGASIQLIDLPPVAGAAPSAP